MQYQVKVLLIQDEDLTYDTENARYIYTLTAADVGVVVVQCTAPSSVYLFAANGITGMWYEVMNIGTCDVIVDFYEMSSGGE